MQQCHTWLFTRIESSKSYSIVDFLTVLKAIETQQEKVLLGCAKLNFQNNLIVKEMDVRRGSGASVPGTIGM